MAHWYRVLRTTQVTLTQVFSQDEVPVDAGAGVTATVRRLDATEIAGSPFTTTHAGAGTGSYSFALPAQSDVDMLTVDWSGSIGGAVVTVRDIVEVVGGFLFAVPRARAAHPGLRSPNPYQTTPPRYSAADLAWWRTVVEAEAEDIIGHAQVPRFGRVRVDGTGREAITLPRLLMLRSVRACVVNGVALDAAGLAALVPTEAGIVYRPGSWWPAGRRNVLLEVEHGLDLPSPGVVEAAVQRMRSIMEGNTSPIPDRAQSWQLGEGGVFRIALPTADTTGIPAIDAVYHRARVDAGGFA